MTQNPTDYKPLEFIGIRYPTGLGAQPRILFGTADRSERFYFQATSVQKNWYGFTTYVDINGNDTAKSETCFYLGALTETFVINLTTPDWDCPAVEDLRTWLLDQITNPAQGVQMLKPTISST